MDDIKKLVIEVEQLKKNSVFLNTSYIEHIRFPYFKNLVPGTRINFDFPLSVLVGQNGCGKSSVLQALYGCPGGNSLGTYWFSTDLDPIKESGKERNSIIYGYYNSGANKIVEVLKQRTKYDKKKQIIDYWEPAPPKVSYNMEKMPELDVLDPIPEGRHLTRWNVILKNVEYIDFRGELSAFDKYFYFEEDPRFKKYEKKQDYLRHYSHYLNEALSGRIIPSRYQHKRGTRKELTTKEIEMVSFILGKKYTSAKIIIHSFYKNLGTSVIFQTEFLKYSEAHAGSGEMAIVNLVNKVYNAQHNSLILLDEPEVSLHPGAQKRLIAFLLDQIRRKKHQIVICSHSPTMVEKLLPESIKVFHQISDGKFTVKEKCTPAEAFYFLGHTNPGKIKLIFEDIAAKLLFEYVISDMGEEVKTLFELEFYPGGVNPLYQDITVFSKTSQNLIFVIFDGDQKPENCIEAAVNIPESQNCNLSNIIEGCTKGYEVKFSKNSNNNKEEYIKLQRRYIDFFYSNVLFLPKRTPEEILWKNSKREFEIEDETNDYKENIRLYSLKFFGKDTAEYIQKSIESLLNALNIKCEDVRKIKGMASKIKQSISN